MSLAYLALLPLTAGPVPPQTAALWRSQCYQDRYVEQCGGTVIIGAGIAEGEARRAELRTATERRRRRARLASQARRQQLASQAEALRERGRGFAARVAAITGAAEDADERMLQRVLADERRVGADLDARCETVSNELVKHSDVVDRHLVLFASATDNRAERATQLQWRLWLERVQLEGATSKQRARGDWAAVEETTAEYDELAEIYMAVASSRKEFGSYAPLELCRLLRLEPPLGGGGCDAAAAASAEGIKRTSRSYSAPIDDEQTTRLVQTLARRESVRPRRFGPSVPRVAKFSATTPLSSRTISWLRPLSAATVRGGGGGSSEGGLQIISDSWELPHVFYCKEGEENDCELHGWTAVADHHDAYSYDESSSSDDPMVIQYATAGACAQSGEWVQRHVTGATVRHLFEIVRSWLPASDQADLIAMYAATGNSAPPQLDGDGMGRLRTLYCMASPPRSTAAAADDTGSRQYVLRACSVLDLRELATVYLLRSDQPDEAYEAYEGQPGADSTMMTAPTSSVLAPQPFTLEDSIVQLESGVRDVLCMILRQDLPQQHQQQQQQPAKGQQQQQQQQQQQLQGGYGQPSASPSAAAAAATAAGKDAKKKPAAAHTPWPEALLHLRVRDGTTGSDGPGHSHGRGHQRMKMVRVFTVFHRFSIISSLFSSLFPSFC